MSTAAASGVHEIEQTLFFTLLQLIVIIAAARFAGNLARRMGQPRAVGEMIAGLILGPSLFGHLFPGFSELLFHSTSPVPISIISQIGLILLMFQIGMDFDFSHLNDKKNRRAVSWISLLCIGLPFGLGVAIAKVSAPYLAPNIPLLPYCLFVGTALAITAVPILGRIMAEYDLTQTKVGAIAISSAAINDVVGWLMLALISALGAAQFSLASTLTQLATLALYVAVCWWVVRPLLHRVVKHFKPVAGELPGNLLATMLVAIFISSMCTYKIGIFAIFGGFMLGVLVHDLPEFVAAWKRTVGSFVVVFFLPIFFTYTGLRTNIAGLDSASLWNWCALLMAAAVIGKVGGAYLGARLAGLSQHQASTIGVLMNTRALMELIVLNVGYDMGFLPHSVFTMLVIMAIATTIMTGPALRNQLPKIGHAIPAGIDA
jgi:Kef-type K+ transport system membrane component KefB